MSLDIFEVVGVVGVIIPARYASPMLDTKRRLSIVGLHSMTFAFANSLK